MDFNEFGQGGYVHPTLQPVSEADELAFYLTYFQKPNPELYGFLQSCGYDVHNQRALRTAIVLHMSKGENQVREILQFHPHYDFFNESVEETMDVSNVEVMEDTKPVKDSNGWFSLHIDRVPKLSNLSLICITVLVVFVLSHFFRKEK